MRLGLSILVVVAGAGAIAVLWGVLGGRAEREASARHIERLQADLDELKAELRRRPATALARGAGEPREAASLARREARDEVQRAMEERSERDAAHSEPVTLEQSRASVVGAFEQECVDPRWSAGANHALEALVREHLPKGSRLGSVECHTTMCRLEVVHTELEASNELLMKTSRGWPGMLFVAKDLQEQGQRTVTVFASREGHLLPLAPR